MGQKSFPNITKPVFAERKNLKGIGPGPLKQTQFHSDGSREKKYQMDYFQRYRQGSGDQQGVLSPNH